MEHAGLKRILFVVIADGDFGRCYKSVADSLGERVHTAFAAAGFSMDYGTLDMLLEKYTVDQVFAFIGSYTDYDSNKMCTVLDRHKYPRSGSSFAASSVINNKLVMTPWFESRGLRKVLNLNANMTVAEFPCVVKRADSCGSHDSTVCNNKKELRSILQLLMGKCSVIEPFVVGQEVSVNFLGSELLSWWEVHVPADEVLDLARKEKRESFMTVHDAGDGSMPQYLAALVPTLIEFLEDVAAEDVVRYDIRQCATSGIVQVMDVNNVACCNFNLFTDKEMDKYVQWVRQSMST